MTGQTPPPDAHTKGTSHHTQLIGINYHLPCTDKTHREAFAHLQRSISCAQLSSSDNTFSLFCCPDLFPRTHFVLNPDCTQAGLVLTTTTTHTKLPDSFFFAPDPSIPQDMTTLAEIAEKLSGQITAVDHTGLVVVSSHISAAAWQAGVTPLAADSMLYDYPASPEYNPQQARWLFVIPSTTTEASVQKAPLERRARQPKFELVWSNWPVSGTVLQIDVETKLTRQQIISLIPSSYDIPGLDPYFRSVNVLSPWPGLACLRFDLRFKEDDSQLNDWNSASWLMKCGTRLSPDSENLGLPQLNMGKASA